MTNKIVEVIWVDSYNSQGWRQEHHIDTSPLQIYSIGILLEDNKETITITTSMGPTGQVMDPLTIPKVAVVSLRELRLGKGGKISMATKITATKKKVATKSTKGGKSTKKQ